MADHPPRIKTEPAQGLAVNPGLTLTGEQPPRELPPPIRGLGQGHPALSLSANNKGVT